MWIQEFNEIGNILLHIELSRLAASCSISIQINESVFACILHPIKNNHVKL